MNLHGLVARLADSYPFAKLAAKIRENRVDVLAPASSSPAVAATIADLRADAGLGKVNLIVVSSGREAEDLASALRSLEPTAEVLEFASWETLPHERLSPSPETVGRRLKVIHRLHELAAVGSDGKALAQTIDHPVFVIATIRAVLQPLPGNLGDFPPLRLHQGHDYFLPELTLKLVELAYKRVDMVTKRGEFAVRGGILDIFATTAEHAVRLEFFGDELDEIREFGVADQRSLPTEQPIKTAELYAAREVIITPLVASRAREMQHEFMNIGTMLAKIAEGIPVDGMEALAPVLVEKLVPFTSFLPASAGVILLQPERSAARAHDLIATNEEFLHAAWEAATNGANAPIDIAAGGFMQVSEFMSHLVGTQVFTVSPFATADDSMVDLKLHEIPNFKALEANPTEWIADQLGQNQLVVLATEGHGTAERLAEVLTAAKVSAKVVEQLPAKFESKTAYLVQASLRHGFTSLDAQLILITESEFFGKNSAYVSPQGRKLAARRKSAAVDPLTLKAGDYVVHEVHGIGRFKELVTRRNGVGKQQVLR
ncbi:MAG: hypothetical protein RLZ28_595, partial [Actinomycetota bacterium]